MANLYFCVNCNNNSVDYKYSNVIQKGVLWLLLEEFQDLFQNLITYLKLRLYLKFRQIRRVKSFVITFPHFRLNEWMSGCFVLCCPAVIIIVSLTFFLIKLASTVSEGRALCLCCYKRSSTDLDGFKAADNLFFKCPFFYSRKQ